MEVCRMHATRGSRRECLSRAGRSHSRAFTTPRSPGSSVDSRIHVAARIPSAVREGAQSLRSERYPGPKLMPRVLLIDDDRQLLDVLSLAFEEAGYEVQTAEDGRAGLAAAATARPDAIVSGVNMP